jgi:hypothetical protein
MLYGIRADIRKRNPGAMDERSGRVRDLPADGSALRHGWNYR